MTAAVETGSALTRTQILAFSGQQPFQFKQDNVSTHPGQRGRPGERCYTTIDAFARSGVLANPRQFTVLEHPCRLPCLPRENWAQHDFGGKRVLFLLPSQALGSNVSTLLFLAAFVERHRPKSVGVFCAGAATDIYLTDRTVQVHPLWLAHRDLEQADILVDLGQLEARRHVDIWPVDMEGDLLEAFGLSASRRYPAGARALPVNRRLRIGILPLASSPLRTVPISTSLALAHALVREGDVTLCLNKHQRQGRLYKEGVLGKLPDRITVSDGFPTIGGLLRAVRDFDYIVCADSGPAHMSKLFATPGVAIYTSAPGDILQGRFVNLARWTVPYVGRLCRAPCGLAKVREAVDGRIGCMESLGLPLEALPSTVRGRRDAELDRLMLDPVPCVSQLAAEPGDLVEFTLADLAARRAAAR